MMTQTVQQWAVAVLVAIAAGYVLWRWLPAGVLRHLGWGQAAVEKASGCGVCSSCSGCGSTAGPSATPAAPPTQPVFISRRDGQQR